MKVGICSLGCKVNIYESELVTNILKNNNYEIVDFEDKADIYIINTEPRNGLATGFSSFVTSDKGQRIILKSGILPAVPPSRVINIRNDF